MFDRIQYTPVEGADEFFTPDFLNYLVTVYDEFTSRIHILRNKRLEVLRCAHEEGRLPTHLPVSEINTGDWQVETVPEELKRAGIERPDRAAYSARRGRFGRSELRV